MGWFSASVSYEGTDQKTQESGYGTRTPNVSGEYTDAFNNFRGSMSPTGLNGLQQGAVDYTQNYLNNGGAAGRVAPVNGDLTNIRNNLNQYAAGRPNLLGAAPTSAAAQATAAQATAAQGEAFDSANVDPITAQMIAARQGSEFMNAYKDPYLNDVVATSLADYDLGAAEGRNALRASSAGAFGNKRTGVAEGQFASDAAIGRGQLSSTLRSNAFNTAAGFGMQDANRFLTADQSNQSARLAADSANADNMLRNNQFNAGNRTNVSLTNAGLRTGVNQTNAGLTTSVNQSNAGLTTQNNQFNAGVQSTRDLADQSSRNQADDRAVSALAEQAGITDTIANNIMTADGIDLDAAENMFTAGTISQAQLQTILDAAAAYNGSSYTDNRSGRSNTDTYGTEVNFLTGF